MMRHADPADIATVHNVINGFFAAWDARDADRIAAMMADDATWLRAGKIKVGPDGAREAMAERKTGTTTAHIVNNIVVSVADPGLDAQCYITTYNEPAADEGVTLLTLPRSIVRYRFGFIKKPDGEPIITRIETKAVFRRKA